MQHNTIIQLKKLGYEFALSYANDDWDWNEIERLSIEIIKNSVFERPEYPNGEWLLINKHNDKPDKNGWITNHYNVTPNYWIKKTSFNELIELEQHLLIRL